MITITIMITRLPRARARAPDRWRSRAARVIQKGMFGLLVGILVACGFAVHHFSLSGQSIVLPLVGLIACSVGVVAVIAQWLRHSTGVKDLLQGGVVDVTCATDSRLSWFDWAIAVTRYGTIDRAGGWLRLQRRAFFGLIPLASVVKPLGEFYRVEVQVEPRQSRRRNRSFLDADSHRVDGYTYTVFLVDRRGDRVCVLDLDTGIHGPGDAFIGRLRALLEEAVGRPGEVRRPGAFPQFGDAAPADAPEDGAPRRAPVDDFDAWRARRGKKT